MGSLNSKAPSEKAVKTLTSKLVDYIEVKIAKVSDLLGSPLDRANFTLLGRVFYYLMTRGKQIGAHDSKIEYLTGLVRKCFEQAINVPIEMSYFGMDFSFEFRVAHNLDFKVLLNLIELAKACISISKTEGTGARGIDLEMIAADYIDQVVKVLLENENLTESEYETLLKAVISDGCMSVNAYLIVAKLTNSNPIERYSAITDEIFKPDTKSNARPFDLTIYLRKHAAQISKSLQYFLTENSGKLQAADQKFPKYAHIFNCVIYKYLKDKYGNDFDQSARNDPYCDYFIDPNLYDEDKLPKDLKDQYKDYIDKKDIVSKQDINKFYVKLRKEPFNQDISKNFHKVAAKLAAKEPFGVTYEILNILAYAFQFKDEPGHQHRDYYKSGKNETLLENANIDAFSWVIDIVFNDQEKDETKNYKKCLINYSKAIGLLDELKMNENSFGNKELKNLCEALLKKCSHFLPKKHYDEGVLYYDLEAKFTPKFPHSSEGRNQNWDLHEERDVIRMIGPHVKENGTWEGLFTIFDELFKLEAQQRPWAILAMGKDGPVFSYPTQVGTCRTQISGLHQNSRSSFISGNADITITIAKDNVGLKYKVTKNEDSFEIYLFNLQMEKDTGLVLDPDSRKILQTISLVRGLEEITNKWASSMFGSKPGPDRPIIVNCTNSVGNTGAEVLYRRAIKFCTAVIAIGGHIPPLAEQYSISKKDFIIIADLLKPFGICDYSVYLVNNAHVTNILQAVGHFKTGMVHLVQGEKLSEDESKALDSILSSMLRELRSVRSALSEKQQFVSVLKEIAIYYAEITKLSPKAIASFDHSVILGLTYCYFPANLTLDVTQCKIPLISKASEFFDERLREETQLDKGEYGVELPGMEGTTVKATESEIEMALMLDKTEEVDPEFTNFAK